MRGKRIQIELTAGHYQLASETPFNDDGPTLNAGLVALLFFRGSGPVTLRNPIFLGFFRGGGGLDPLSPLWSTHECNIVKDVWSFAVPV